MKQYRKHDWPALIAAFEASGLSQAAFCAQKDINPGYFSGRRRDYLRGNELHANGLGGFTAVQVRAAEVLPNGFSVQVGRCTVHCPAGVAVQSVADLVERLA